MGEIVHDATFFGAWKAQKDGFLYAILKGYEFWKTTA